MIKINLAKRKQSAFVAESSTAEAADKFRAILDDLTELPLVKIIFCIIVIIGTSYGKGIYREARLEVLENKITKLEKKERQFQKELQNYKGFKDDKKQLEGDEALLRNKIETIKRLMEGRKNRYLYFKKVAEAIPEKVWLQKMTINGEQVSFTGKAKNLDHVSTFINGLNQLAYLRNIQLEGTNQKQDGTLNMQVVNFNLKGTNAFRRIANQ